MKVLVACEYTGRVRNALRKKNINAWSCDIKKSIDDTVFHIQKDLKEVLKEKWNAIIAFPPCTHLAVSGAKHFHKKQKEQKEALEFVKMIFDYDCEYLCLENPVSIISSKIKKPTQYIQPYEFGHPASKKICLWLKGFPNLQPTKNVYDDVQWDYFKSGKRMCRWYSNNKQDRDKTFENIAIAMSEQWYKLLI